MKKSTIVIVEDDPMVANNLKDKLEQIGCEVIAVFCEGENFCSKLKELHPERILVDLTLKGDLSGIEATNRIREVNEVPVVYLAENHDRHLPENRRGMEPYGYIVKPFHENEAQAIIEMALQKHSLDMEYKKERDFYLALLQNKQEEKHIFVKSDFKIKRIELDEICYVEALKDYIAIHTVDNTYTTHSSMKEILKTLSEKDFIRIHRSYIVRINKISSIKYPELLIEGKMTVLPMGGLYRKDVYERLNVI